MFSPRVYLLFVFLLPACLLLSACTAVEEAEPVVSALETVAPTIEAAVELTPRQVTESFYEWYLAFMGDRTSDDFVNPLVEGLYRQSEFLSPGFIAAIDELLAGPEGGGFDPILLAQDVPVRFETRDEALDGLDAATVTVDFYWGGNPDPSVRTVQLIRQDGRWLIDGVTAESVAAPGAPETPTTPAAVTAAFYDWYLGYIGDPASDEFRNPMVDRAYHDAPYLTERFVTQIDELLASFTGGGYDPFLCAQAIPTEIGPDVTFMRAGTASVVVRSSFPNHQLTVELVPEAGSWAITNIACAQDPAGIATAFYTWYLGYMHSGGPGAMKNPLADQAYREQPLLAESFVAEVDALLADAEQGGYDPFLLAQDVPQGFSVEPGAAEDTAVVELQFGPESVRRLLVTIDERRRIAAIADAEALPEPDEGKAAAFEGETAVFSGEGYGFSFGYPADWVVLSEPVSGPGVPEEWPVEALWLVMPPETAEALEDAASPPDPAAPPIVAPFHVEIVVGDEEAMTRVYPDFAAAEPTVIGGLGALVIRLESGYGHVFFPFPKQPETWLVFTDWVTEFPGREAQAETAGPVWQPLLQSVRFSD